MTFKPMLACREFDMKLLRFPVLVSAKLDGIRCMVQDGGLTSRSLKPIPNRQMQERLKDMPQGYDGELIKGNPLAVNVFNETTGSVRRMKGSAEGMNFHVFDYFDPKLGFADRYERVKETVRKYSYLPIQLVEHVMIHNADTLLNLEEVMLDKGAEGLIIRKVDGRYKQGRSTANEGLLWKLKRFEDSEARIVGFEPLMRNNNAAFTNELGRTARSSAKAGKVADDLLGKLVVVDLKTGVEFEIGTGFDMAQREELWQERTQLIDKTVCYKYFPVGTIDKPRHPVFKGFRESFDIS